MYCGRATWFSRRSAAQQLLVTKLFTECGLLLLRAGEARPGGAQPPVFYSEQVALVGHGIMVLLFLSMLVYACLCVVADWP